LCNNLLRKFLIRIIGNKYTYFNYFIFADTINFCQKDWIPHLMEQHPVSFIFFLLQKIA